MNRFYLLITLALLAVACDQKSGTTDNSALPVVPADSLLEECAGRYLLMIKSLPDSVMPRTFEGDTLVTSNTGWWTSGFYPGTLWYLYEATGNEALKQEALRRTALVEREKFNTGTHDLGFMLYCSFGNAYRLTGDTAFKKVLITGAHSLCSRFNPRTGLIKSWDFDGGRGWQYPVIIDNMMNLEFLFAATRLSGDSSFWRIAVTHADTTLRNHFRNDFSSFHVVDYDSITGRVREKVTWQGASDSSAWARGQGWGLYGYTMMYRETRDEKYLDQAGRIADYLLNHSNLPSDKIPYWDFNAPGIPNAKRDASAGALIASALLELADYVSDEKALTYRKAAAHMLLTLASPEYLAAKGTNGNFILKHSVGALPFDKEVDVPLTYADYYFVEALLRYSALMRR